MINTNGLNALIIAGNILLWPIAVTFLLLLVAGVLRAVLDGLRGRNDHE